LGFGEAEAYPPAEMGLPVRFHPEALLELNDAASSYGERLVGRLEATIERISEMPHVWPLWPGRADVHRRVLTRWPYAVIYTVEPQMILIIAIEHHKRRPGYWLTRL
jgi:plasmid stabilization system protein ParE